MNGQSSWSRVVVPAIGKLTRSCASWERGINEHTRGLIRQYFPKRTDCNEVSDEQIKPVMDRSIIDPEKRGVVDRRMNYLWGSKRICSLREGDIYAIETAYEEVQVFWSH